MSDSGGVWVKVYPDTDSGAANIGMSSVGVDNAPDGKPAGATDLSDGSYTYTDGGKTYRVLAFTDDGRSDLTLDVETAGFADVLVVGGGGGGTINALNGKGGYTRIGSYEMSVQTYTVTVGAGGAAGGAAAANNGYDSSIGTLVVGFGGGVGGGNTSVVSSITGSAVTYATQDQTSVTANSGNGGISTGEILGSSGVVIIRVEI